VLIALIDKGSSRQKAYELVQQNAMNAWKQKVSLLELLKSDAEVTVQLSTSELESLFDYKYYLRHIDKIFERLSRIKRKELKQPKTSEPAPKTL